MKPIDLTGQAFGRWIVLRRAPDRGDYVVRWVCQCGCSRLDEIASASLRKGLSTQCRGCAMASRPNKIEARRERAIWTSMRARCENPRSYSFHLYGARGIKVCERWRAFDNFYADMGPRPSQRHSLERLNGNGDYEPGNVVWALPIQQGNNTRSNRRETIGGRTMTLAQWAREYGADYGSVRRRIHRGWTVIRALTTPKLGPGGKALA